MNDGADFTCDATRLEIDENICFTSTTEAPTRSATGEMGDALPEIDLGSGCTAAQGFRRRVLPGCFEVTELACFAEENESIIRKGWMFL